MFLKSYSQSTSVVAVLMLVTILAESVGAQGSPYTELIGWMQSPALPGTGSCQRRVL